MTTSVRIGSLLLPTDPYWVQVRESVKQRAQELGIALISVHLPINTATGETQLSLLEDLFAHELDALITPYIVESTARQIVDAGLPIIFSDEIRFAGPGMVSPRGLYDAATLAASFLVGQIGYRGTVLLIGGCEEHLATVRSRVDGFQAILAKYPAVHCIQIPTYWRYDQVYDQLIDEAALWRSRLGDQPVAGIFGLSDSLALAARDAGRHLGFVGDHTRIVGINGDPLAIAAIVDGSMHGTVETSAHDLARNLLHFACQAASQATLPAHFPYALQLISRENAVQVAAEKLVAIAALPSRLVDVSRRQEEQRLVQMHASLEINRRVGSSLDSTTLLRELADIIGHHYKYDHVQFFLWREADGCLALAGPAAAGHSLLCVPLAESGALGQALLRNQACYIPDTLVSTRFAPDPRWPDARSRVVLPVRVGGKTLGVLDLHNRKRTVRTQVELDALQTLADQAGVAMRNAELYAQALEAKAEAERANLLKTRLLANVSHELRTPLNIILGYSQAALSDPNPYATPLPDELRHDLHHIQRSGGHLVRLVEDLLNLSQAEIGALELYPEALDAHAFLTEVFDSMAGSAVVESVAWRLQLPATLPSLHADPVRLRQVLLNLLSNAAKFTAQGHITLSAVAETPNLHIWVEDTGVGIPPSLHRQILEAFVTRDAINGDGSAGVTGIGLGLSVAHRVVALHGGRLWLESRLGHGTICHLHLPLAGETLDAAQPATNEAVNVVPATLEPLLKSVISQAGEMVQRAAHFVGEHYASGVLRDDLAAALGLSPDYVSRVFRRETGMSLKQYLTRYRVAQAQKLLQTTHLTVTQIACTVGIDDSAYFSRVFHQESGKSPQQYRKSTS